MMSETLKSALATLGAFLVLGAMYAGVISVWNNPIRIPTAQPVAEEPDPVPGEVWYDPTDDREQDPFDPRPVRQARVLEVRGEWLQYEFNGGADGKSLVKNSTRTEVFKRLYRRTR